jgi:hypothetical protein
MPVFLSSPLLSAESVSLLPTPSCLWLKDYVVFIFSAYLAYTNGGYIGYEIEDITIRCNSLFYYCIPSGDSLYIFSFMYMYILGLRALVTITT